MQQVKRSRCGDEDECDPCKPCNRLAVRMCRLADKGAKCIYAAMTKEKRDELLLDRSNMKGKELAAALYSSIEHAKEIVSIASTKTGGKMLDSPDLAEKYKDKPEQLLNVQKNARKVWHPVRECFLYDNYDISSDNVASETDKQPRRGRSKSIVK